MKILLTGFGPFGKVVNNPSERIAAHFALTGLDGHSLTTAVLPVSYRRAGEEIARLLEEGEFDVAVLTGVAVRSEMLRLELFARNRSSVRKKDAGEESTAGRFRENALPTLSATVSAAGLAGKLRSEDIPARVSRSAGDYVCNHTYYAALDAIYRAGLPTACLFVHLPADEQTMADAADGPTMNLDAQIHAIEIVLRQLAR